MAHLIKLAEYISRYQSDLQRYTSQYTRMKKERWYYLKSNWEQLEREGQEETGALKQRQEESILMKKLLRIKEWGKGNRRNHMPSEAADLVSNSLPLSLEQVRVEFLDELFQAQLRWASTSLVEESRLHPQYRHDEWLRFFSQQIPDNYLLMYKPVFYLQQAPVDLDIILISPTEVICLTILEGKRLSVFEAVTERFWTEFINKKKDKKA